MSHPQRLDFETLMHDLTLVGVVALAAWSVVGLLGLAGGYLTVNAPAAFRFLSAVFVLLFARRLYHRWLDWHYGHLAPDARFGFEDLAREHHHDYPVGARGTDTRTQQTQG